MYAPNVGGSGVEKVLIDIAGVGEGFQGTVTVAGGTPELDRAGMWSKGRRCGSAMPGPVVTTAEGVAITGRVGAGGVGGTTLCALREVDATVAEAPGMVRNGVAMAIDGPDASSPAGTGIMLVKASDDKKL